MVEIPAKYQEGVVDVLPGFWIWNCPACRSTVAHKGTVPATVPAHCSRAFEKPGEVRLVLGGNNSTCKREAVAYRLATAYRRTHL